MIYGLKIASQFNPNAFSFGLFRFLDYYLNEICGKCIGAGGGVK
jgi:hypothetical protein